MMDKFNFSFYCFLCPLTYIFNLIAFGQARALVEWHNVSRFCGHCGSRAAVIDAGRRKQCTNESCRKRIYPRVDPVKSDC